MAHTKMVHIHRSYLASELHSELLLQSLHPEIRARLLAAVRGHQDARPSALPSDARILAHSVDETSGNVTLTLESESCPCSPDGPPFSDLLNLAPKFETALPAAVSEVSASKPPK